MDAKYTEQFWKNSAQQMLNGNFILPPSLNQSYLMKQDLSLPPSLPQPPPTPTPQAAIKCAICSKVFPAQPLLELHMKEHASDGKKFVCEICNKSFIQSNNLATHMRIHNNEKNYECPYCGKKFSQSNNCKTHQR